MLDFNNFGTIIRDFPEHGYRAVWRNLKTYRLGKESPKELPPEYSEFYDIGINNKCSFGNCPFCYVAATRRGENYGGILEAWKSWMKHYKTEVKKGVVYTNRPFVVAIGSTGEPTEHPEFSDLLKIIYESGVVPTYTTNGVILSKLHSPENPLQKTATEIMRATRKYVGGVAVSLGNRELRENAELAVKFLVEEGETLVNLHHIISGEQSIEDFLTYQEKYGESIKYQVLLPLIKQGRSEGGIKPEIFERLLAEIQSREIKNIAFGAHFYNNLREHQEELPAFLYPPESLSKNLILKDGEVIITPSSFDLRTLNPYI